MTTIPELPLWCPRCGVRPVVVKLVFWGIHCGSWRCIFKEPFSVPSPTKNRAVRIWNQKVVMWEMKRSFAMATAAIAKFDVPLSNRDLGHENKPA